MKRRLLTALLFSGMMVGILFGNSAALPVQATEVEVLESAGDEMSYENFSYEVYTDSESDERFIRITDYIETENVTEVNIPSEINGVAVKKIDEFAFYQCSSLTSINLPESITEIDEYAFCGCSSLTSINLPENLKMIGIYAFCGCCNLKSIELPEGLTSIGPTAFALCSSLTSIKIPKSLTIIESEVFMNCSLEFPQFYPHLLIFAVLFINNIQKITKI